MLCFLDDTNNSKFETTIDFVDKTFLHDVVPCGSNKVRLAYKLSYMPTVLFVSLHVLAFPTSHE